MNAWLYKFREFIHVYICSGSISMAHRVGNSDVEEISGSERTTKKVADSVLFDQFQATYRGTTSKEELSLALVFA